MNVCKHRINIMAFCKFLAPVLLVGTALMLNACDKTPPEASLQNVEQARSAKIVPVLSAGVSALRSYPGTLEAYQKAELAFRVEGQLIERPARPGLRVKKGDELARLDDAVYRNTVDEREARYGLAKIQFDQSSKLLKQKLSSQLKHDQSVAEMKSARAALDQARDNLSYTRLLAPFDGVVARINVDNYQAIKAKEPIIQLQNDTRLDVHFSVPETLISQLKKVQDPSALDKYCGNVTFSNHPAKFYRACHKEHESVPDPLTRNYAAVFTLDEVPGFAVLPGMTVTIALDFSLLLPDDRAKGLLIPLEAVFEKNGQKWVWRVDAEMRAHQVPVEVGRFEGQMLEITEGLSSNDRVIAAGVTYIRENMLVRALFKERGL
jgi:RND family efflux transporter MFP subunit